MSQKKIPKNRFQIIASIMDGTFYKNDDTKDPAWSQHVRVDHVLGQAEGLATDALYELSEVLNKERLGWLKIGDPRHAYAFEKAIELLELKATKIAESRNSLWHKKEMISNE